MPHENADICLRLVNEGMPNKHSPVAPFRNARQRANSNQVNNRQGSPTDLTTTSNNISATTVLDNTPLTAPDIKRLTVMEEILKYLKIMVAKRDEDDSEVELINEWQQVAMVMDRFLFWFFLLTTIVATIIMMVVIPLLQVYTEQDPNVPYN